MSESKYYGVSTGDGNDGVCHTFPSYIVKTNQPWLLAELAALSEFKYGEGREWAKENMEIDGDEDCTISAVFHNSPEDQKEYESLSEEDKENYKGRDFAWFIVEVFPYEFTHGEREFPVYHEGLAECFGVNEVLDCYESPYEANMTRRWKRINGGIVREPGLLFYD